LQCWLWLSWAPPTPQMRGLNLQWFCASITSKHTPKLLTHTHIHTCTAQVGHTCRAGNNLVHTYTMRMKGLP
jgi:hypothetical protein